MLNHPLECSPSFVEGVSPPHSSPKPIPLVGLIYSTQSSIILLKIHLCLIGDGKPLLVLKFLACFVAYSNILWSETTWIGCQRTNRTQEHGSIGAYSNYYANTLLNKNRKLISRSQDHEHNSDVWAWKEPWWKCQLTFDLYWCTSRGPLSWRPPIDICNKDQYAWTGLVGV